MAVFVGPIKRNDFSSLFFLSLPPPCSYDNCSPRLVVTCSPVYVSLPLCLSRLWMSQGCSLYFSPPHGINYWNMNCSSCLSNTTNFGKANFISLFYPMPLNAFHFISKCLCSFACICIFLCKCFYSLCRYHSSSNNSHTSNKLLVITSYQYLMFVK